MKFQRLDLNDVKNLAERLAYVCQAGDVVFLDGDLGAGKTQFAKFFIKSLSDDNIEVISPTFTLVQTYDTNKGEIWHFDLYRIEDEHEIEAIGFDEALAEGISLVEWPKRLGGQTPKIRLDVLININADETRHIELKPHGARWQNLNLGE